MKLCSKCNRSFPCHSETDGRCWCMDYRISPNILTGLRDQFDNCLCPECLDDYTGLKPLSGRSFFCSWSGGKDSCLALYHAIKGGGKPLVLLTMMIETGDRSRSHGLTAEVLEAQAESLGIPISFCATSWKEYEGSFLKMLDRLKASGICDGVFGDIDLEDHRAWIERVCGLREVQSWLPLWKRSREDLITEWIETGFRSEIVAVKDKVLSPDFLGRVIDTGIVDEFRKSGIDLSGEAGEYHTVVTDGPIFRNSLHLKHGERVLKDGYWFSDVYLGS